MSGTAFDPRLMAVEIQVNNELRVFNQDFWIKARGEKCANAVQNTCDVELSNLDEPTRNYILTETSPFNQNRTPKILNLKAGRASTGLFLVYTGDVQTTAIHQPPDITLRIKCGTSHSHKGRVGSRSGGKSAKLSTLAGQVAANLGLSLRNEAPDVNIANYAHSGNALDEVGKLGTHGKCACYVDDGHLILKPVDVPLSGDMLNLSEDTGLVGIPVPTEQGLRVKFMFDGSVRLGGAVNITSKLNPAVNGVFVIFKLRFELSSRETEFYYDAECLKAKQ